MLKNLPLNNILFLDVETVPLHADWKEVPEQEQELWAKKTHFQRQEKTPEDFYYERAGILAEFAKVVCISCGLISKNGIRIKSFYGQNEKNILLEFNEMLSKNPSSLLLCAHNGKEFDYPFLSRRMIINDVEIPLVLNLHGRKPWEVPHLDTLELWKFGDYKHYTSLDLMAYVLGLPTPKSEMDGSQVAQVFYEEKDLDKIVRYCEGDVKTLINVFLRLRGNNPLELES